MDMKASDTLIGKLKEFEGLRLEAYKCPAGAWTIGYGHTRGVRPGQKITEKQAEELLRGDLLPAERTVNSLGLDLTQGQFDALVSFVYNVGEHAFLCSSLLDTVRRDRRSPGIRRQLLRWTYGGGKELEGLRRRREWEAQRYFQEDGEDGA